MNLDITCTWCAKGTQNPAALGSGEYFEWPLVNRSDSSWRPFDGRRSTRFLFTNGTQAH
jgi:hypothetical protein